MLVYLNGEFLPREGARISVDDRGFLFADGVYEVVRVYRGGPFLLDEHLARMRAGLRAIRIDPASVDVFPDAAERLLRENGLDGADATLYLQVTRGAAPRLHAFPAGASPTVYAAARPFQPYPSSHHEEGVAAITVPDTRWSRCDVKSIALLPNVLANQQAKEVGAFEAVLVRDGVAVECSSSNLFAVLDGALVTYPACNYILAGITRGAVLRLSDELGIPVRLGPIPADGLHDADELFLTSTTAEVLPIVRVGGRPIGDGRPGPVTRRVYEAFRRLTGG